MVMFDSIEDIFDNWRKYSENARALVTFATAAGTIFVALYFIRFVYEIIQGLRLYLFSQLFSNKDQLKKYGQWVVITGATDGIGLGMARELARRGHSIIVVGRNDEKLSRTKLSLEEEPNVGEVITVKIDLSDSSAANYERIRDQIDPDNRDIGILINNAGVFDSSYARFHSLDMEFVKNMVNVNIIATLYFTRMILPSMKDRQRGLIINVSSGLGQLPAPYMGVYGPSKAFINAFSRSLQIEYSPYPIDIINLTPGAVHTKLFTAINTIPKPTFINPTPESYAYSSLNAVSTRINSISGCMAHGLTLKFADLFNCLGLVPIGIKMAIKFSAKDSRLSPVAQRKRIVDAIPDQA